MQKGISPITLLSCGSKIAGEEGVIGLFALYNVKRPILLDTYPPLQI